MIGRSPGARTPAYRRTTPLVTLWLLFAVVAVGAQQRSVAAEPRRWGLIPLPLGGYTPDTLWYGGVGALAFYGPDVNVPAEQRRGRRTNTLTANVVLSQSGRYTLAGALNQYLARDDLNLSLSVSRLEFPGVWYGLGPDSDRAERFDRAATAATVALRRRVAPRLYIGPQFAYHDARYHNVNPNGTLIDAGPLTAAHLGGGISLRYARTSGGFAIQTGQTVGALAAVYAPSAGHDRAYFDLSLRARVYRPFGPGVIAAEIGADAVLGDAPLHRLARIGGDYSFRGLPAARYVDRFGARAQWEYRLPLFWWVGVVGFASIGQVGARVSDLVARVPITAAGVGLRLLVSRRQRINLRLDVAFANGARRWYVGAGEAF